MPNLEKSHKLLRVFGFISIGALMLSTQSLADQVRNDMAFTCKYEAKRNFGVPQGAVQTLPVERVRNRFVVYAQTPRNTQKALFFECIFDNRGEYIRIKRNRDMRQSGSNVPKLAKRACRGEAADRWRIRNPNEVKINKAKRVGGDDYMIRVSARGYRGRCETSGNGNIYMFKTVSGGNSAGGNNAVSTAVKSCKREAQRRWRMTPNEIGADRTKRLGGDNYMVYLSARGHRAECETNRSGRIYLFSE